MEDRPERSVVVGGGLALPQGDVETAIQYTTAFRIPLPLSGKNGAKAEDASDSRVFDLSDCQKCDSRPPRPAKEVKRLRAV